MTPEPMNALILSGGVAHPYPETSRKLAAILERVGCRSRVTEDFDILRSPAMKDFDIVVLNCVYCTFKDKPDWRDTHGQAFSEANRAGLLNHLRAGKGLLALHCATICFDDWPEFPDILGASWQWGKSGHAPYGECHVKVCTNAHPIVAGIGDFTITDELYTFPVVTDTLEPFMTAEWNGAKHPLAWVRSYGKARVCYLALGHDTDSFANGVFQKLLQRSALWVAGRLVNGGAA